MLLLPFCIESNDINTICGLEISSMALNKKELFTKTNSSLTRSRDGSLDSVEEKTQRLVSLILEENMSSIALLSMKLLLEENVILDLIESLVEEGTLTGSLTADGRRFFKGQIYVPTSIEDEIPGYPEFDSKPGTITIILGIVILSISTIGISLAPNSGIEVFFYFVLFIGVITAFAGCYYFGTRKTIQ